MNKKITPDVNVMSKNEWQKKRVDELLRAINTYIDAGVYDDQFLYNWCWELTNLITAIMNKRP